MWLLRRIHGADDSDCVAEGVAETAGGLLEILFDDWGFGLTLIGCVVVVVFLGVSALGLMFGQDVQSLRFK